MDEDAEFTLIYVDMLGFGALIKDNPTRLVHRGPDKCGLPDIGRELGLCIF